MRLIGTIFFIAGTAYVAVTALMFLFQSRLVHLPNIPSRELTATPARIGLDFQSVEILTEDGIRLHGWFLPAGQPRGTLLFLHGNAGNISHRLESLEIFHRLDLSILIIDYRGYGRSEGTPSEQGLYQDAEAALRYLRQERAVPPSEMVYFGRSLGGSVAAWLAARHPPGALILESSFTSVPELAAELYPLLPARWLARLRYDTREYLKSVRSPVLIIHSADDEITPFHHGRKLFEAAENPKRFLEIQGDHNAGFLESRERYVEELDDFLDTHLKP